MSILFCILLSGIVSFGLDDVVDVVESDELDTALEIGSAFSDASREITETEEYYIGRAVAANILHRYGSASSDSLQMYINRVGKAVSVFSPRPSTFGGYHFMLLESSEINGLACPGGLVFITRGLFDLAESEDELAGILAHEVAHVALSHGLNSVEKAKWVSAFSLLGTEAADRMGSNEIRELTENYGDIVEDITSNLVTRGYSRSSEEQADSLALEILSRAGYDPQGLGRVLQRMSSIDTRSGPGFWQTHPSPEDRLDMVAGSEGAYSAEGMVVRTERFQLFSTSSSGSSEATGGRGRGGAEPDQGSTGTGRSRG